MISSALKKTALSIALIGFVGSASASVFISDTRTFNAGVIDSTWASNQIDVNGYFDHTFNFTAGALPTLGSIAGFDFAGNLETQYRFGSTDSFQWSAWSSSAAVPSDSDGLFSFAQPLGGLTAGNSYTFEIRGYGNAFYAVTLAPVPEPESYAMLLAGLGLLGAIARRKKNISTVSGE